MKSDRYLDMGPTLQQFEEATCDNCSEKKPMLRFDKKTLDEDEGRWHGTCIECIEQEHQERLAEQADDPHERAAARARDNDFEDTDGKDWT